MNKKQRYYKVKYWASSGSYHEQTLPFKNYNDAYEWIYFYGGKPLTVKYKGWR